MKRNVAWFSYRSQVRSVLLLALLVLSTRSNAQEGVRIFPLTSSVVLHEFPSDLRMSSTDRLHDTSLVVWSTVRITRTNDTIAQLYGAFSRNGQLLGDPFHVTSGSARPRQEVANSLLVAACGDRFAVLWNDYRSDAPGIYRSMVSTTGVYSDERKIIDTTGMSWLDRYGNPDSGRVIRFAGDGVLSLDRDGAVAQPPKMLGGRLSNHFYHVDLDTVLYLIANGTSAQKIVPARARYSEVSIPEDRLSGIYTWGRGGTFARIVDHELVEYDSVESLTPTRRITLPRRHLRFRREYSCILPADSLNYLILYGDLDDGHTGGNPTDIQTELVVTSARVHPDNTIQQTVIVDSIVYMRGKYPMPILRYSTTSLCDEQFRIEWLHGQQWSDGTVTVYTSGQLLVSDGRIDTLEQVVEPDCQRFEYDPGRLVDVASEDSSIVQLQVNGKTDLRFSLPSDLHTGHDTIITSPERTGVALYNRFGRIIPLTSKPSVPVAYPWRDGGVDLGMPSIDQSDLPPLTLHPAGYSELIADYGISLSRENALYDQVLVDVGYACLRTEYNFQYTQQTGHTDLGSQCRSYTIIDTKEGPRTWLNDFFDDTVTGWSYYGFQGPARKLNRPALVLYEPNSATAFLQFDYQSRGIRTAAFGRETPAAYYFEGEDRTDPCSLIVPIDAQSYYGYSRSGELKRVGGGQTMTVAPGTASLNSGRFLRLLGNRILHYTYRQNTLILHELDLDLQQIALQTIMSDSTDPYRIVQLPFDSTICLYQLTNEGIRASFLGKNLAPIIEDTLILVADSLIDFDVDAIADTIVLAWTRVVDGRSDAYWHWFRTPTYGRSALLNPSSVVSQPGPATRGNDVAGWSVYTLDNGLVVARCLNDKECGEVQGIYSTRGSRVRTAEIYFNGREYIVDVGTVASGEYYLVTESSAGISIVPICVVH